MGQIPSSSFFLLARHSPKAQQPTAPIVWNSLGWGSSPVMPKKLLLPFFRASWLPEQSECLGGAAENLTSTWIQKNNDEALWIFSRPVSKTFHTNCFIQWAESSWQPKSAYIHQDLSRIQVEIQEHTQYWFEDIPDLVWGEPAGNPWLQPEQ